MSAFTEADVQLVATADHDVWCDCGDPAHARINDPSAHAILTALADAGRLTPDGAAEPTTWWGIRRPNDRVENVGAGQGSYELAWIAARRGDGALVKRDIAEYADGSTLTGPWVAADGTP